MKKIKYIILIILYFLPNSLLYAIDIKVETVTEPARGHGSYQYPWVYNQLSYKFKFIISGEPLTELESYLYNPQIHMDGYRNCSTQWDSTGLSFGQVNGVEFTYTADMTGNFYLRCDYKEPGNSNYTQSYWEDWGHVRVETPPVISFSTPYTPPAGNNPPTVIITPTNIMDGVGSSEHPWIIHHDSTYFRFTVENSYDPDGPNSDELDGGVFCWGVYTHPGHFYHTAPGAICDEIDTYLFYDDMDSLFSANISGYEPDKDKCYFDVFVEMWDKWGAEAQITKQWVFKRDTCISNPTTTTNPIISVFPDTIDFDTSMTKLTFRVMNTGTGTLNWSSSASINWYTQSKYSGYIGAGESTLIYAYCERDSIVAAGCDTQKVTFTGGDGDSLWVITEKPVAEPSSPKISISPDTLNFKNDLSYGLLKIANIGDGPLSWSASESISWFAMDTTAGEIEQGRSEKVAVQADRTSLADGSYSETVSFTGGGGATLYLELVKDDPPDAPKNLRITSE